MNEPKRDLVFKKYINQHLSRINLTIPDLNSNPETQIPYAQFLFSINDYFGLLFDAAINKNFDPKGTENLKLFLKSKYFDKINNRKNFVLLFIRNGLMHQIFPKATGVGSSDIKNLFFKDIQHNNQPTLNLKYFEKITLSAIMRFIEDLKINDIYIENLHQLLIIENPYLNDRIEFQKLIEKGYNNDIEELFD